MEFLNYHHLLYFWTVAREGSVVKASERLLLAPSTISSQVRALEDSLDAKLFERIGRGLKLTDMGRLVFRYADEIFSLGRELLDTVQGRPVDRPMRLDIGVADVVPKLVARKLIEPALQLDKEVQIICREGKPEQLLAELAQHHLDVVLLDSPMGHGSSIRAFNHLLGECEMMIYGTEELIARHSDGFPRCLDDAPFLLPLESSPVRRALEEWLDRMDVRPLIVGEFEDSALMKVFGQTGVGFFPAPGVIRDEIERQYNVKCLGTAENVVERFYAISVERRLKHPAVVAISASARENLFA
jgi:LysR family transcriptional activator of nhaA